MPGPTEPWTSLGPTLDRPSNRLRGVLSTLRDVNNLIQHSQDEDRLRKAKLLLRSMKRKRQEPQSPLVESVSLQEIISQHEFTVVFFFHPRHAHSLQLRSILSDFCAREDTRTSCLAAFGGDPEAATAEEIEDCDLFFDGTGFLQICRNDEPGQKACASLLRFLDVTQIPTIVVIPNSRGRPIMGQEMALEWNASKGDAESISALLQRWREGGSGLSISQSMLSSVLGNSSSVCTLM